MLLAGLWYSKQKPTMSTFLRPLVSELNELFEKGLSRYFQIIMQLIFYIIVVGVNVTTPDGLFTCHVALLLCSVDLPARAIVGNMKQFNGKCGCIYCEDTGRTRPGSYLARDWPYTEHPIERTSQSIRSNVKDNTIQGEAVSISYSRRPL